MIFIFCSDISGNTQIFWVGYIHYPRDLTIPMREFSNQCPFECFTDFSNLFEQYLSKDIVFDSFYIKCVKKLKAIIFKNKNKHNKSKT